MGNYVRVFCTEGEPVPLRPVLAYLAEHGAPIALDSTGNAPDLDDDSWEQADIIYENNKAPIVLEISREVAQGGSFVREEIEEFRELLRESLNIWNRVRVARHLRKTRFIVAARLPTSDIDNDGYEALGHLLNYFVDNNGGMVQADGEGFYRGRKLILRLG